MKSSEFPFQGQWHRSSEKKYKEVIFFVHFFYGHKKALSRHVEFVNQLGFDAFSFQLQNPSFQHWLPLTSKGQLGWKHYYAEQIETLLNLVPGPKIVFSFSNPSAAAIEAIARRGAADIKALICDSGPSGQLAISGLRLCRQLAQEKQLTKMLMASTLFWSWSLKYHHDLKEELEVFPKGFPVLSIRGWKDELITAQEIDLVFEPHQHLKWKKLSLPEAHHIQGLKQFPNDYKPPVEAFLKEVATLASPTAQ